MKKTYFGNHLFWGVMVALGLAAGAAAARDGGALTMAAGDQTTLLVTDSSNVTVDEGGIVAARAVSQTDLLVTALTPGATRLHWTDADGHVHTVAVIVTPALSGFARNIADLLRGVPNAKVIAAGNKVVIDGKLITLEDMDRVARIAQAYGDQVLNLTVFDRGPSNDVVVDFIRRISGIETVKVNVVGQTAYLSGHVFGQTARSNVVTLARAQVANVVDMIQVRDIMIETEVIFAKITKSGGFNLGMNLLDGSQVLDVKLGGSGSYNRKNDDNSGDQWASQWSRSLAPPGDLSASEGGKNDYENKNAVASAFGLQWSVDLLPKLNVLVNDGDATILARPRLGTKNGEVGKFHSGGEYYYEVSGVQAADLKNVEYGFQLSVQPEMISDDKILNNIAIEVSVPAGKSGSEELNLDKFQVENTTICQLGQSIVVSGFLQNLRNYVRSRTPILGDIPLIGFFFSKRVRTDENQDLVAIVTPRLLYYDTMPRVYDSISTNVQQQLLEAKYVDPPAPAPEPAGVADKPAK